MSEKRPDLELDEEMKRKLKLDGAASGSAGNQETLKSKLKPAREKGNQARAVDEDILKEKIRAKMGEGPRRSSKGQTRTLIFRKSLTYGDLLTGELRVPLLVFSPKKREGKHGRMMVPFVDRKGEFWELEATPRWLSLNLDKFMKAHRLRCNNVISFYEAGSNSRCYIIDYERSGR